MHAATHLVDPQQIAALIVAASFAAGLNTYATVATLGILSRMGYIALPGALHTVGDTWVIMVALALFAAEFFADKLPAFDLVWNAAHTFVRVPVAALMGYAAASQLPDHDKLLATVAGGLIAAVAHSSKTAARVLVTPSPEPVSNIALSTVEDGAAIGLTWFATHHPYGAAGIVACTIVALVLSLGWIVRRIRGEWRTRAATAKARLRLWTSPR